MRVGLSLRDGFRARMWGFLFLAAVSLGGCRKNDATVLSLTSSGPVDLYNVKVWDRSGKNVLDTDFVALPSDIQERPYTIGLKLPLNGGSYTVVVIGVAGSGPDRFGRLPAGSTEYFYADRFTSSKNVQLSARLLMVPSQRQSAQCLSQPDAGDADCDGDLWPDPDTWLQRIPEAAQFYGNKRDLLDCNDRTTSVNVNGTLTDVDPSLIHPFATELCRDGIDETCNGNDDEQCLDSDGDSDPDEQDCAVNNASIHHPTTRDPYPESPNCCGYSLGKTGVEANQDFSNDPLCHVGTCSDGIDQDCSGGTDTRCIIDNDCDGSPDQEDCDDNDPNVSPRAVERCNNNRDDNCNGLRDEICVPCDLDGDGYQRNDPASNCLMTGPMVDCVDTDSGISPGTMQVPVPKLPVGFDRCDGTAQGAVACARRGVCRNVNPNGTRQDADCNGLAGRICATPQTVACDADGDGFAPANMISNDICRPFIKGALPDCNDADPEIFPNAPEVCGDGIAQSCLADVACTSDLDGDRYNDDVDCDSTPGSGQSVHPWADEVCNGLDDDCDGLIDEGNPDDRGQPLVQNSQVQSCTDSNVGVCGTKPGMCVCSGVPVNDRSFNQGSRRRCPGGSAAIDVLDAANTVAAPKCYFAGQPSSERCDGLDNDCDAAPTATDDGSGECPGPTQPICCASAPTNPGCTNTQIDTRNCGSCGTVCNLPNAVQSCVSGVCAVAACNPSTYMNCNAATAPDGCECNSATSRCVGTSCLLNEGQTCASGSQCASNNCCSTRCTDVQSDVNNCGTCGNSCVGRNGGACVSGVCGCQNTGDCNSQIANQCNGNICQCAGGASCNSNTQRCVAAGCRLRDGQTCIVNGDCASGACSLAQDGTTRYCTTTACGTCQVGTASGSCTPASVGTDPKNECGNISLCQDMCNGSGACRPAASGVACNTASCTNSTQTLRQCNGTTASSCPTTIQACPGSYTCANGSSCRTSCGADADCIAGYYCNNPGSSGSCLIKRANGQTCTQPNECTNGNCSLGQDGSTRYCTANPCGLCRVGTSTGACVNATLGTDPKNECSDVSLCQNMCNGSGACRAASNGTTCGASSCTDINCSGQCTGTASTLRICDGSTIGSCPSRNCGNYICADATSCLTSCTRDADCIAGYFCSAGTCQTRRAAGQTCSRDGECQTNACIGSQCQQCGGSLGELLCAPTAARCNAGACATCTNTTQCTAGGLGNTCVGGNCTCAGNNDCNNPRAPRCVSLRCTCGSGQICPVGQLCSDPTATTATCRQNADQPCQANGDCISGTCTAAGICAKNPTGAPCLQASDCAGTTPTCTNFVCG